MYHKPKVSVIIPCYNSENYLKKAVDSVLNQSICELQIILVDDGSIDKTPVLLQQYKMQDNRVEVVTHSKNIGLGAARNSGIKIATGEYLFFLDSDDYIHPNSFEVLYDKAQTEQLDILQAQHMVHENGDRTLMPPDLPLFPQAVTGIQYFNSGFLIEPKACAKLWRTDFLKKHNLQFATGYYEDMAMVFQAFAMAERVNNIAFATYHYIIRRNSITQQAVSPAHIAGFKQSLIDMQQLFMRPELTGKQSAFTAGFFLYLKELSALALQTRDASIINETKDFVNQMTSKYAKFLSGNRLLPVSKRVLLKKSPFLYAQLKKMYKKS